MESIKQVLGDKFSRTIIEDEILDPYFITVSSGCFTVSKKRVDKDGNARYKELSYPSSFLGSLNYIAKEKIHEEGKVYESIQEYIETWKEVSTKILNAYKDWKVEQI